ncbi:hypothetical protein [Paraburkholderia sp. BR14374]|uniref:hypothetical protein n=1 Tax=Paraburkholderia sp. BR14374 TaxID=3237007 RepID=UPI0034CFC9C7
MQHLVADLALDEFEAQIERREEQHDKQREFAPHDGNLPAQRKPQQQIAIGDQHGNRDRAAQQLLQ